ncbi:DUF1579 domain-containing protein [bacterium]|nr:DUF1579 domain-containing protein [bacterium]
MRHILALAALAALVAVVSPASAQDSPMDPAAMEKLMVELATPGPQHQLLAGLTGEWTTTMTNYMSGPEPVTTTGTYSGEALFGGRYFVGHHEGEAMGQPFAGMNIDGFDNSTQKFFSMWIDNFGTGYYLAHGELDQDGKTLRHAGTMNFGPMEIPSRSVTVFVSADEVNFTMWHTMDGQEIKAMDLKYERVK